MADLEISPYEAAEGRQYGLVAAASGGGYCEPGIDTELALLTVLGAFGVSFAILYMASSTATGRKKREDNSISGHIMDVLWEGLEDFERKVDLIKEEGVEVDESPSWIHDIFNRYSEYFTVNDTNIEVEDLEPPMLDETWGLHGSDSVKKSSDLIDTVFQNKLDEIYNNNINCRAKMWRCATLVAEEGIDYLKEPEGITGVLKSYLFKIGFQGADVGRIWNAVLSIPEARKLRKCMAADERCKEHEILLLEMNRQNDFEFAANNNTSSRLLVNPEVVQELDQSDGSKKYDEDIVLNDDTIM